MTYEKTSIRTRPLETTPVAGLGGISLFDLFRLWTLDFGRRTSFKPSISSQIGPRDCLWATLLYYDPLSRYLVASTMANFFSNLSIRTSKRNPY